MSKELPFDPYPFTGDPHTQTILGCYLSFVRSPPSSQKLVTLPDGDKISLEVTTPTKWTSSDLTVVFVHGLCGSHESPNLVRMASKLNAIGVRSIRFNMRGCGSGHGLCRRHYHSGRSEDLFECLKVIKQEHPESPIILVGYSLGGNIALKLAGELSHQAPYFLKAVIAVTPPVDLYASIQLMADPMNSIYETYFYRVLRSGVHYLQKNFHEGPRIVLPAKMKIYEFDQLYTAPAAGFESAMDYYQKCSSMHLINDISIPCKILFSEDDPIICHHSLDHFELPSNIEVYKTKKGGHMGYLGSAPGQEGFYWLDWVVKGWIFSF